LRRGVALLLLVTPLLLLIPLAEGQKLVKIGEILEDPYKYKCAEIKVRGIVTEVLSDYVSKKGYVYQRFYIRDDTGEIKVFCSIGKVGEELKRVNIREGMEVEVTGSSGVYKGEPEIKGYYKGCPRTIECKVRVIRSVAKEGEKVQEKEVHAETWSEEGGTEIPEVVGVPDIKIKRELSSRVLEKGDELEVTILLENTGDGEAEVYLTERLPRGVELLDGETSWRGKIQPGDKKEMKYRIRVLNKGTIILEPTEVEFKDSSGREYSEIGRTDVIFVESGLTEKILPLVIGGIVLVAILLLLKKYNY